MRRIGGIGVGLVLVTLIARPARAQAVSDTLDIRATSATTWIQAGNDVILLRGPVTIALDRATLAADNAIVWLAPATDAPRGTFDAQIALLGSARVEQNGATRSGEDLLVTTTVRDDINITTDARRAIDQSNDPLYRRALELRSETTSRTPLLPGQPQVADVAAPTAPRATSAVTSPVAEEGERPSPVTVSGDLETTSQTPDRKTAIVLRDVLLIQTQPDGTIVQLQAERGVIFTDVESSGDFRALAGLTSAEQQVSSAYLEGDVRISQLPPRPDVPDPTGDVRRIEQRLEADRVYYDFRTSQAVLTDAIFRTMTTQPQLPITLRAQTLRQLSQTAEGTELSATDARLSTSSFAVPSYSVAADRVYVRQEEGDETQPGRTVFAARDVTFRTFGVPTFWLPRAGGAISEGGLPLRSLSVSNSRNFGVGVETEWGLFESFGRPHPEELDASYKLDYFTERGPAAGLDAEYGGGFIRPTTKQPWNFTGELESYVVFDDDGIDDLGRYRTRIPQEDELRGRVLWRHQHFFPEGWQAQIQGAYVSDETFLEEWFEREFDSGLPQDTSLYFKHQDQSEAVTFLASVYTNELVTSADQLQEVAPQGDPASSFDDVNLLVERVPEVGYHRVGDSLLNDNLTFFSTNTVGGLRFETTDATLADLGFRRLGRGPGPADDIIVSPGMPSIGTTGFESDTVYRGDFRQQIDYPFSAGPIHVVPYVMGRLTAYTDSPDGTNEERLIGGTGVRVGTTFWKVMNDVHSRLFDLDRMRHVVEPELHLFTSAQTTDRGELFIYDEPIDAVTDLSAMSVGVRQRWQTKRGGPGRRRSADFFTLNAFVNIFGNEPEDVLFQPEDFRGLYFPSHPEASVPRDSLNIDALLRISDTTILVGDVAQNLEEMELATAAIGLAVQRGDRLSYFTGVRHIEPLDSTIASFVADYELTRKYTIGLSQSYDFGDDEDGRVYSSVRLRRRFDRFAMLVTVYHDDRDDESGVRFSVYPEGLGVGIGTDTFSGLFGP